jgi:uncharacterized protein (DUF302 family)
MDYYLQKQVDAPFDQAVEKITEALKTEGFGIITEIDMKATLKKKLDVDFKNYKVLGACNPKFAYEALQTEEQIGIMLPCNVTVVEQEGGKTDISIVNPEIMVGPIPNPKLEPFAQRVKEMMVRALEKA